MYTILNADARHIPLPDGIVQTCVTSPPYYGLRDFGHDAQIGLEESPAEYVANVVAIMREVKRVLRDDGTLWLNLGDSYAGSSSGMGMNSSQYPKHKQYTNHAWQIDKGKRTLPRHGAQGNYKPKDMFGIPWRVAFALQDAGWYLRSDIIWEKPNAMPESVEDRPTKSHEYLFLLAKSQRYFYDGEAIKEPAKVWGPRAAGFERDGLVSLHVIPGQSAAQHRPNRKHDDTPHGSNGNGFKGHSGNYNAEGELVGGGMRNKRSVWHVSTDPYAEAHFATYPPKLIEPCILAGSRPGDIVLDPFCGSGTTGAVALEHGRRFIGLDLNTEYINLAHKRIAGVNPRLLV